STKLVAISAMELADLDFFTDNYTEAIEWLYIALNNYTTEEEKQQVYKKIADCYIMLDNIEKAFDIYEELQQNLNSKASSSIFIADIYKNKALAYCRTYHYKEAHSCINKALEVCKDDEFLLIIYLLKSSICTHLDDFKEAYQSLQKAIKYATKSGRLDVLTSQYQEIDFQKVLLKSPDETLWQPLLKDYVSKDRYKSYATLYDLYNKKKLVYTIQHLKLRNQLSFLIITISVLGIVSLFWGYRRSKQYLVRRHQQHLNQQENQFVAQEKRFESQIAHYKHNLKDDLLLYHKLAMLSLNSRADKKSLADFNRIIYGQDGPFKFDWEQYKTILNRVYPNYEIDLLSKYGEILSQKEIEVILLQKGGF
ncbi:MAG: tetratricopeptide repeat protein, partial [Bacteroides sp.]